MTSTCLVCCEEASYFVLPPCNHKNICWKCGIKLIQGSIFSCPFCMNKQDFKSYVLFVNQYEMQNCNFEQLVQKKPYRSQRKSFYYYSQQQVAQYIEQQTSFHCQKCGQVFLSLNILKKHLNQKHSLQYCSVCLDGRKYLLSEQKMYLEYELQFHLQKGEINGNQVVLYHPLCHLCNIRLYNDKEFSTHLRIATHFQCHICTANYPQMQYVYYKDYNMIQQHFKKSHFMCDKGQCISQKLTNVFISDQALLQHIRKQHRKCKNINIQKPEYINIKTGFNEQKQSQHIFQWDGIGKNMQQQFTINVKHQTIQKRSHQNTVIDIRQFYKEQIQTNIKMSLSTIFQYYNNSNHKENNKINFNNVHMFQPLNMPSLTKIELQGFLRKIFFNRSNTISNIFFHEAHQFKNFNLYFYKIKKQMQAISLLAYYYAFPQLIRFMKPQNKRKVPMDEFYAYSLRDLQINRHFIFHQKVYYMQILDYIQNIISSKIYQKILKKEINIQKYINFLQTDNINYYIEVQKQLFYVPRQKIINLYHMIDKCKMIDMLKFNWLLKVGFHNLKYTRFIKLFFFSEQTVCSKAFDQLNLQQMSLLYVYVQIFQEAINLKDDFRKKKNYQSFVFGKLFDKLPQNYLNEQIKQQIKRLQQKHLKQQNLKIIVPTLKKNTGVIIHNDDDPSLLVSYPYKKPQIDIKDISITHQHQQAMTLSKWNENSSRMKNNIFINKEDFPTLQSSNKNKNNETKFKIQQKIYNNDIKFVNKKANKNDENKQIENQFKNNNEIQHWDEEKTLAKIRQQVEKEEDKYKIQEKKDQLYIKSKKQNHKQDISMTKAIEQSMKTYNQQISRNSVIIQGKKFQKKQNKKDEERYYYTKNKKNRLRVDESQSQDEKIKNKQMQEIKNEQQSIINRIAKQFKNQQQKIPKKKVKKNRKGKITVYQTFQI